MEAMWTRYLPVTMKVKDWINSNKIGEIRMISADFGYRISEDYQSRALNPELGGGGLLDVGVYPVSYAYLLFKEKPSKIVSLAHIGKSGVDEQSAVIFQYSRGQLAQISSAVRTRTQGEAWIIGTEGSIHVPEFWRATSATLFIGGKEIEKVQIPFESNGYKYEIAEAVSCLRDGKLESPLMPLDETISIMETLDQIRGQWGLKYPMEK
jgi:predicted dehydrogenase